MSRPIDLILRLRDDASSVLRDVRQQAEGARQAVEGIAAVEIAQGLGEAAREVGELLAGYHELRRETIALARETGVPVEHVQALQAYARDAGVEIQDMAVAASQIDSAALQAYVDSAALLGSTIGPEAVAQTQALQDRVSMLRDIAEAMGAAILGMLAGFGGLVDSFVAGTIRASVTLAGVVDAMVTAVRAGLREMVAQAAAVRAAFAGVVEAASSGDFLGAMKALAGADLTLLMSAPEVVKKVGTTLEAEVKEAWKAGTDAAVLYAQTQAAKRLAVATAPPPGFGQAATGGSAGSTPAAAASSMLGSAPQYGRSFDSGITTDDANKLASAIGAEFAEASTDVTGGATAAIQGGVEKVAGAVRGGFTGILSLAGPWGTIIGLILDLVPVLDQFLGSIPTLLMNIVEDLPALLSDSIPELVSALTTEVGPAITAMLTYDLIPALWTMLKSLFKSVIIDAVVAVWRMVRDFWERLVDWLTPGQQRAEGEERVRAKGRMASGGYVHEDGLYWLHRKERVLPGNGAKTAAGRSQAAQARTSSGGGGGDVHVHFHGPVVGGDAGLRELIARINAMLGPRGRNLALGS